MSNAKPDPNDGAKVHDEVRGGPPPGVPRAVQRPSLGRIVLFHFKPSGGGMATLPAMITDVFGVDGVEYVSLQVFGDRRGLGVSKYQREVRFVDAGDGRSVPGPDTWTWPPRV